MIIILDESFKEPDIVEKILEVIYEEAKVFPTHINFCYPFARLYLDNTQRQDAIINKWTHGLTIGDSFLYNEELLKNCMTLKNTNKDIIESVFTYNIEKFTISKYVNYIITNASVFDIAMMNDAFQQEHYILSLTTDDDKKDKTNIKELLKMPNDDFKKEFKKIIRKDDYFATLDLTTKQIKFNEQYL